MSNRILSLTMIAFFVVGPIANAQRPGGGRPGGQQPGGQRGGPGGGAGGRANGPPPGMNRGDQNRQNQQNGDRFGNQEAGNQNMPSVNQLAQMLIGNFDADGSGGLEQGELQNALTALREMMQNRNSGQNQVGVGQPGNAQNQQRQGAFGQNNQAFAGNAQARQRRGGANGAGNNQRGGRGR